MTGTHTFQPVKRRRGGTQPLPLSREDILSAALQTGRDRVAKSTMTSLDNGVAAAMLGKGRTSKDLGVKAASRFRRDFFEWVQSDQERLDRYEGLDPNLVEDYVKEVDETLIAPLRRRYGADAMSRYRAVENLPVGGHSSAPVGTPKPKGKAAPDEDAAADAAWANFKERQAAAQ